VERILEEGLHESLDAMQVKLNLISAALYGEFFLGQRQAQTAVAAIAG